MALRLSITWGQQENRHPKTFMDFRCNECHKLLCVHHSPGSPSRSWLSSILAGLVHSSSHPEVLSITPFWSTNRFGLKQGKYSCVDQEQSLMHCVREPPVRTLHTRGSRTLDDLTTCDQTPVLRRPHVSTMCAKVAKGGWKSWDPHAAGEWLDLPCGNILAKRICFKVQGLLQVLGECAAQNFAGKLQKALWADQDHKDVL